MGGVGFRGRASAWRTFVLVVSVVVVAGLTLGLTVGGARTQDDRGGRAQPVDYALGIPGGQAAQPASLVYDGDTARATAYAAPGGLVVAGRDNLGDPAFDEVSRAGGTVLAYLDPVLDNPQGRYHQLLLRDSACGPAASSWPGSPQANEWGTLADFRPGSVVQRKLRCVLETMVAENPQIGGWFADDVGSRSHFPDIAWDDWDRASQQAYRDGAIELTRTFREVADEHGLVVVVNGTWGAGDLAEHGGGYPDPDQHGNALVDGAVVENHDTRSTYFSPYACSPQWAADSGTRQGRALNYAITETRAGLLRYAADDCFAYANVQPDYSFAAPWAPARDLGLPSSVRR